MAKFVKNEAEKSLVGSLTLLVKENREFLWVEFGEISAGLKNGFEIFNEAKAAIYRKEVPKQ